MLNEARLRMANTPEGAALIDNPVSAAPGFQHRQCLSCWPACRRSCSAMFDGLKPGLAGGAPVPSRTVSAFLGEGVIAKGLGELQAALSRIWRSAAIPSSARASYRRQLRHHAARTRPRIDAAAGSSAT